MMEKIKVVIMNTQEKGKELTKANIQKTVKATQQKNKWCAMSLSTRHRNTGLSHNPFP